MLPRVEDFWTEGSAKRMKALIILAVALLYLFWSLYWI
jgi:hypothetical protein